MNDHLNSSYELKEEKKKQAEDKAMKKKDKMEQREVNKRQKIMEKEQKRNDNTCKACEHLWKNSPDWVGCDFCDSF